MIFDRLENAHLYKGLHPAIDEALDYISSGRDFTKLEIGRHHISDQLDAIIDEYETQPSDGSLYEAHRQYIDVQVMLAGDEYMGVLPLANQTPVQAYNEEKDFALYQVAGQMIHVKKGMFIIFFPTDLHMPCIGTPARKIRKLVLKARVNAKR